MEPAIFLDRDNTLIANRGDLGDAGLVRLIDGAAEALLQLRGAGYRLVVVTNQGGVARGKFSEADVDAVHQRIAQLLDDELHQPELIERFYYCPYHPEGTVEEYRREHSWRKPNPGMILQAGRDMELDLQHSWMIGDQHRDIAAGRAAGCRTLLLCNSRVPALQTIATKAATSLAEAATLIVRNGDPEPTRSVAVRVLRQMPAAVEVPTVVLEPPPAPQMRSAPQPPSASKPLVTIELPQDVWPPVQNEPPVVTEIPAEPEPSLETEPPVEVEPPVTAVLPTEPEPSLETEPPVEAEPPITAVLPTEPEPSLVTDPPVEVEPPVTAESPTEPEPSLETEPPVEAEPSITAEFPSEPGLSAATEPAIEAPTPTPMELPIVNNELEAPEPPPALDAQPSPPIQLNATVEAPPQMQTSLDTEAPPSVDPPVAVELPASVQTPQTPDAPAISEETDQATRDFSWEVPAHQPVRESPSPDRSLTEVRRAILELSDEVRSERVRRSDLTPAKMTAGIMQLLVVLCAFFGLLQLGDPESFEAFVKWILGGALLQLVTITLLLLDQR